MLLLCKELIFCVCLSGYYEVSSIFRIIKDVGLSECFIFHWGCLPPTKPEENKIGALV